MILKDNTYKFLFYAFTLFVLSILLLSADSLSISYKESLNYFVNNSILSILTKTSTFIFGENDLALRLPFILFYIASVILMFRLTEGFFKQQSDRFVSIIIFMIIPGLLSASLLVNSAIIVTFFTLLYIYYFKTTGKHFYILLFLFLFLDNSFAILFLALFFYSLNKKDNKLILISLGLFILSMLIYGFDSGGKPRGFLVDTFAIYASIFSPLLFIYFFYTLYRSGIKKDRTLVWYIATTSFIFSLLLSFRQRIYIEDYAPFVIIFIPYMVRTFFHTIRVRLPQFRHRHFKFAYLTLTVLVLNVVLVLYNKPIYLLLENPKKHFAYKYNVAKELALRLHELDINNIQTDKKMALRLKFYGINEGRDYYLSNQKLNSYDKKVTIKYHNKSIYTAYLINLK